MRCPQVGCYLALRLWLGDLDQDATQKYRDAAALYVVLLVQYLSLRRTDLAHRREFVRLELAEELH